MQKVEIVTDSIACLTPERTYYRLTKKGIEAGDALRSNPLFTLYPKIGPSHMKKSD